MNNLDQTGKWLIAGAVMAILIAVLAVYGWVRTPAPVAPITGTPGGANATASVPGTPPGTQGTAAPGGGGGTPATVKQNTGGSAGGGTAAAPMIFSTPIPGEVWKINTQNPIAWSREGGFSGQIELLDATTKKLVGVILNQIGPHQTSFTWNTRDILLGRNNPAKTTVMPGRYVIKISFDGNNLPSITSQPFSLEY